MKQSVTVGAQLLWGGRYGCNNGRYGYTIVMSYIEINKAVSQWLLNFNLCVSVTWPLTCAFHIPCTHTPETIDMHRGMCDNGPDTLQENLQTLPRFGLGHTSVKLVLYSQLRGNNKKAIWAIYELPCANRTGDADRAPTFSLLHEKIYNQLTRNPVYDQIVVKIEITFYYSQSSS